MTDEYDYAWNHQTASHGPFIRDRTAHLIAERDGRSVVADCGFEFYTETGHMHSLDEDEPPDRHKCGNCGWE